MPNVANDHLLHISIAYRNDPKLPPEQQFEVRGVSFSQKDDPECAITYDTVFRERPVAIEMGKMEMGSLYWGTGVYLLMIKFRKGKNVPGEGFVPLWKHFGIDKLRANAVPACRSPVDQLTENLEEGRRPKFCCGKVEGMPTCCCGGWTHEVVSTQSCCHCWCMLRHPSLQHQSGHEPKVPW